MSSLINNQFNSRPRTIASAKGVWLTDLDDNRYLDGSSGAVVVNIGHGDEYVSRAVADQLSRVSFTHRGAFTSRRAEQLADRLCTMTGYAGAWFVNSGSEAVEAAMQFALQYFRETNRSEHTWFLSHKAGYHGNTLGSLSTSGHARRAAVGSLAFPFPVLPTPYAFRDAQGITDAEYAGMLLTEARALIEQHANHLAGIVIEPVGGATLGATVPPDGYLQGIRRLCDEFGILLIADEVMTGLGRTGSVLAVDHWDMRPDIVVLGKGLGAGYTPVAGALVSEELLEAIAVGSGRILGGHTYAGNPLSMATALAVLDVVQRDGLVERAKRTGEYLAEGLEQVRDRHPFVADARGLGMLRALEFDRAAFELGQGVVTKMVTDVAMGHGLMLYGTTGGMNDAVLVAPPLTIARDEVDFLIDALDRTLTQLQRTESSPKSSSVQPAFGASGAVRA